MAMRALSQDFSWPVGFERFPDEEWTRQPLDGFGLAYDTVARHGWYSNLDPTVAAVARRARTGDIILDYSGGTGIFLDRLKAALGDKAVGAVIADSSPKFLRVALEKYRQDPLVGLRVLHYLKEERRLMRLDEVLPPSLLRRRFDAITSTNAIHLYPDVAGVVEAWADVLRPGGRVFISSGNIRNPRAGTDEWILDETVAAIAERAEQLVANDPAWAHYRPCLDDTERMAAHRSFRDRVFLAPRPVDFYVAAIEEGGLNVEDIEEASVVAEVDDWYEFLTAYHEAILGWVGGTERIDGCDPTPEAVDDRLRLMREAMEVLFGPERQFRACWTYLTCL
jgi:SAM-dependent methyltransferase